MKRSRIFLLIILIVILSGAWYFIKGTNLFNEIIGFTFSSFLEGATYSGGKTRNFFQDYLYLVDLKKENERLKEEILLLKSQIAYYKERERIYKELEEFYKLSTNINYPKIAAKIIYKPMDPFSGIVFIDKGSKDGLLPQMPVLASVSGEGVALVGQVAEVYRNWSKVILITDPSFSADVKIERTGDRGILVGKAEKYCNLQYLPSASQVKEGDEVLTSGQDAFFPPGLLIGKVIAVNRDPIQGMFKYAEIEPSVNLHNLDLVFVLLKLPEIPL
ncbi:rod shape-determining protein MreC [Thermodesulfobacterium geofontis OPF15]|uniref:Cell shape-determining protein MreC n=1 Tax=Thermodesulfobacterium geofontis (strain OPF15) TaxID=795359 RepID=F8C3R6_THEGP|nr:rod shape-determining protein MreC [Thermodesulfobacterium geofontis]AEH23633.1 rod shape-determining protein MreC [Thermodesulfobacterium geofontis OPF15]